MRSAHGNSSAIGGFSMRSDIELLDAWGQGDRAAGSALFARHFDALYRFFSTKVRDGIADLVQQTLLECVEARARFRRDCSFRTYLFQIARHNLYAHYRARKRVPEIDFTLAGVGEAAARGCSGLDGWSAGRRPGLT